jgi:hypothetical protein
MVIKMDKDQQTIVCTRACVKKIDLVNVRRDFQNVFRDRQKDIQGIFGHRYGPDFANERNPAPIPDLVNKKERNED